MNLVTGSPVGSVGTYLEAKHITSKPHYGYMQLSRQTYCRPVAVETAVGH